MSDGGGSGYEDGRYLLRGANEKASESEGERHAQDQGRRAAYLGR